MEGQDGALSGITAENGGNVYGGNGFEKDRRGAAYHTEMDRSEERRVGKECRL